MPLDATLGDGRLAARKPVLAQIQIATRRAHQELLGEREGEPEAQVDSVTIHAVGILK